MRFGDGARLCGEAFENWNSICSGVQVRSHCRIDRAGVFLSIPSMHQLSILLHNTGQLTQSGDSSGGSCRQMEVHSLIIVSSALPSFHHSGRWRTLKECLSAPPSTQTLLKHSKSASSRAFSPSPSNNRVSTSTSLTWLRFLFNFAALVVALPRAYSAIH